MPNTIFITALVCTFFSLSAYSASKYTGPIIDVHVHAYKDGSPLFGLEHPPTLRGKTYRAAKNAVHLKQEVLKRFHKYNIVKAVVTAGELWLEDAPTTILVANATKPPSILKKQHELGYLDVIAELAPFYEGKRLDHPSIERYFKLAEELGVPIGVHIFPGGPNFGLHYLPEMLGSMRAYNASPGQIENLLVKYPKLKLYIMHGGWPFIEDLKSLLYMHPNVYVDIAVVNWILPEKEVINYILSLTDSGFGDRILYGSDQMVWPDIIDDAIATINDCEALTLKQKADIFYNNAAKFLGLTDKQMSQHRTKKIRVKVP
ncbi:hypothetical protein BK026_03455 [Alteromonas sp. V450]|nr:hypothetical protein BK026_03455 [Alteromonas sp. V450]